MVNSTGLSRDGRKRPAWRRAAAAPDEAPGRSAARRPLTPCYAGNAHRAGGIAAPCRMGLHLAGCKPAERTHPARTQMHTRAVQPQKAKRDDRAACARGGVKMRAPQRQPAPKGGTRRRLRAKNSPLSYGGCFLPEHRKRSCCQTTARPIWAGGKRGASTGATRSKTAPKSRAARPKGKKAGCVFTLDVGAVLWYAASPLGAPDRASVLRENDPQKKAKSGVFCPKRAAPRRRGGAV